MRLMRVTLVLALGLALAATAHAERLRVTATRANVRSKAAMTAAVVATLDRGTELEAVEKVGAWYRVRVPATGAVGFVSDSVVEVVPEPPPAAQAAPPRPPLSVEPPRPTPPTPVVVAPPPPPPAKSPAVVPGTAARRFTLVLNGLFLPTKLTFSETRSFTEFAESGEVATDYSAKAGPGGEVGLRYLFTERLGVLASVTLASRSGAADFSARLPHPLYLGRHRQADGSADGLSYSESTGHLDLVVAGDRGSIGYSLFAGASFFQVKADLLESVGYSHAYPFDSVTVGSLPTSSSSASAVGFNVGGDLVYRLNERFGVAIQARFSRAKVELAPDAENAFTVDAGGVQVAGGIRVRY
jgi:hypothetical protein